MPSTSLLTTELCQKRFLPRHSSNTVVNYFRNPLIVASRCFACFPLAVDVVGCFSRPVALIATDSITAAPAAHTPSPPHPLLRHGQISRCNSITIPPSTSLLTTELGQKRFSPIAAHMVTTFAIAHRRFSLFACFPLPSMSLLFLVACALSATEESETAVSFRALAQAGANLIVRKRNALLALFTFQFYNAFVIVPHFEKMLYDQGQLANAYLNAFCITKDVFYSSVFRDILDYLRRDMIGPTGEIFSAEDADSLESEDASRKKEGAFYVWRSSELGQGGGSSESLKANFVVLSGGTGGRNGEPLGQEVEEVAGGAPITAGSQPPIQSVISETPKEQALRPDFSVFESHFPGGSQPRR
nr:spermatogenesis-associated protein 20 [Ipomoea batatas]